MQIRGTSADSIEVGGQYPISHPYAKGKAFDLGVSTIASGGAAFADLVTVGFAVVTIFWRIGNATTPATASGDINGYLNVYEDDGTVLYAVGLTPDFAPVAATLSGSTAYQAKRYLLNGVDKVRVNLQNNNAAPLQGGRAVYYLQK